MSELPVLLQIILATLIGGVLSVGVAALVMFGLPRLWLARSVSFSTGMLLATALLDLLPEALESTFSTREIFTLLLAGILGFFVLEKYALWRHVHVSASEGDSGGETAAPEHGHSHACEDHSHAHHHWQTANVDSRATASMILLGDSFHNFTDGLLLAATFVADPVLGWSATLALLTHEVPREAGDFAVLFAAGWERKRTLIWSALAKIPSVLGAVLGYFWFEAAADWVPAIITVAAASFIYIAVADLMPRLKREPYAIGWHGVLLATGVAVAALGGVHAH